MSGDERILRMVAPGGVRAAVRVAIDAETLARAAVIVRDVGERGESALREWGERLGDVEEGRPLVLSRDDMARVASSLDAGSLGLLERVAARIDAFARAQRGALCELDVPVPGGRAGQWIEPVERAGCYAPGGRFPLPSSVLMTVVTARAAGVTHVVVASPRPAPITIAAAHVAGADELLCVGGAQAIAAMASGAVVPRCDVIVGPGNRWVTAAKKLVSGEVGIDSLAGPSELVVVADGTARGEAALIAADLLAQAEHDTDASAILVTTSRALADDVDRALAAQLASLPTHETARAALANGMCVVVDDLDMAVAVVDQLAPEHLQLLVEDPRVLARRVRHFGAVFLGPGSAEVFGDYGVGPNHVLPTGGAARHAAGLSVLHFLRVRTWLEMDDRDAGARGRVIGDTARLARLEGLEAHARAAEARGSRPR